MTNERANAEFTTLDGFKFRIKIFDDSFSGTSHEFQLVDDGLRIEYANNNKSTHDELMTSAATITWVARDSADESFLDDLRTYGDGNARLYIERNFSVGSGTFYPFWHGVILDEITLLDEQPRIVELQFTDDLGLLDEVLYKETPSAEYTDQQPLPVIITRCLSKLRWWSSAYSATDTALKIQEYVTHDDISGTPAADNIIANHLRFRNPDNNGEFQYFTAREILVLCLRVMQSRIVLFNGVFWIRPAALFDGSTFIADNYLISGALDTSPDLSSTVEFTTATNYRTNNVGAATPTNQLAGLQFGTLPPLSECTVLHKYDGLKYDWWGGTTNTTGNWYAVDAYGADTTTAVGEVVTVTFAYQFSIDGDNTTLEGARAKLKFRIRHGSTYAKRAATNVQSGGSVVQSSYTIAGGYNVTCFDVQNDAAQYSTNTASYIEVWSPVYYRAAGAEYINGVETITFPPLSPSTGATEIETPTVTLYAADGTTTYAETASVGFSYIYQMHGAAIAEGDAIRYRRTNADTSAREIEDLDEIILGDRVSTLGSPQTLNWAINISGTYTASTPDWNNAKFPAVSQPIASLVCWDRMAMRLEACETVTGTIRYPYFGPITHLLLDSKKFVPTALVYNVVSGFWDVEAIEHKYNATTVPADGVSPNSGFGLSGAVAGQTDAVTVGQFAALVQKVADVQNEQRDLFSTQANTNTSTENRFSALELDDLADVSAATPNTNDVLKYDGASWRAAAVSGGGASSLPDLDDVNSSLAPGAGDLLIWTTANGGEWNSTTVPLAVGSQIDAGDLGNVTEVQTGRAGDVLLDYALGGGAYWISTPLGTATKSHVDLDDIKNVDTATPSDGDLLRWNATTSKWTPYTPPAAVSYITIVSSFYSSDGNGDYIPIGGTLTETTSDQYYNRWIAPMAGEVVSARVFATGISAGVSTLSISKYNIPQSIDSDSVTISSANVDYEYTFTTATFVAGDQLRFWFDPSGTPGGVCITLCIKLTHP